MHDIYVCVCVFSSSCRTMEPECFDFSMVPKKKCGTPPVVLNGFVLVNMFRMSSMSTVVVLKLPILHYGI